MFRRWTYRRSGARAPHKMAQLFAAFRPLVRRSPRESKLDVKILPDRSRNGHWAADNGARREARRLSAILGAKPTEDASTTLVAPHTFAKSPEPVTDEGGIVRFGLGTRDEHKASAA
jgi:hypothetical protein